MHGATEQTESDRNGHDYCHDDSSDYEFLAVIAVEPSVHAIEETSDQAPIVNENKVKFQIDFGASINIINRCHTTGCHITPSKKP